MNASGTQVLVVDLARVLDESAPGKAAAAALQARFEEARAQHDKLLARATTEAGKRKAAEAAQAFEGDALRGIEAERARMRADVLAAVRPVLAALMQERKAQIVVDAAACLAVADAVDVTDELLTRLR